MKPPSTLSEFIPDHLWFILNLYEKNEKDFDPTGLHGRPHIIRSIVIAEILMNFYKIHFGHQFLKHQCFFALAFHDLGRQENGPDYWMTESAMLCKNYLRANRYLLPESEQIALYISNKSILDVNHQVVCDADTFEILRIVEISKFNQSKLHLCSVQKQILSAQGKSHLVLELSSAIMSFVVHASSEIPYLYIQNHPTSSEILQSTLQSISQSEILLKYISIKPLLETI